MLNDALKLNRDGFDPAAGVRVALAVTIPIVVGVLIGRTLDGVLAALGAFNVALAEGVGSYSTRALRVGAVLVVNPIGIGVGTLVAGIGWWGLPISAAWVLVAAYAGVIGPIAERIGWFAAMMFIIGLGLDGFNAGRVVLDATIGGIWAVIAVAAMWPLQPNRPALRAIASCQRAVGALLNEIASGAPLQQALASGAKASAAVLKADAASRWIRVRSDAAQSVQRRLRQLVLESERAYSNAVALDQQLRDPAQGLTPEEITSARTAAGQLAGSFTSLGAVFNRGHEPFDGSAGTAATALAQRVDAAREWTAVGLLPIPRLCQTLALIATEEEAAGLVLGPPDAQLTMRERVRAWSERSLEALRANLSPASFWLRYAVRFAVAIAVAFGVAQGFGLLKGYWVLVTVAIVVKPQLSLSTTSTLHRVGGTVIGSLLAVVIVISLTNRWALIAALFVLAVLAIATIPVNYGLGVVFLSPLILVMLNIPHPGQWQLADARVLNTLIGAGIGLLATTAILRGTERGLVPQRGEVALRAAAGYLQAIGSDKSATRMAKRFAARATLDDLLTVIDRAVAEPESLDSRYLNAATQVGELTRQLWDSSVALASAHPAETVVPQFRSDVEASAKRVEAVAEVLSGQRGLPDGSGPPALQALDPITDSLRRASLDLVAASRA